MATLFGSGIKRREDPRLITGSATYTDDVKLPGLTYAAILRSPYAHAKLTRIDVSAAREAPGVLAICTHCWHTIRYATWATGSRWSSRSPGRRPATQST
jgi:CO/xanthine dehydrogenase Mo-binding subunit